MRLPERELLRITAACASLGVDGVRGDIVTARAARALAALDGLDEVGEEHVRRAAALALLHRRRRDPLDGQTPSPDDIDRALDDEPPPEPPVAAAAAARGRRHGRAAARRGRRAGARRASAATRRRPRACRPRRCASAATGSGPGGRRARSAGEGAGAIDCRPAADDSDDVSIVATLRARLVQGDAAGLREHVRGGRESVLLCLVVDASGSMGARRRLARVKGALLASLREAYERRDRVAVDRVPRQRRPAARAAGRAARARRRGDPAAADRRPHAARRRPRAGRAGDPARGRAASAAGARIAVILTDGRVADPSGEVRRAAARLGRAADAAHVIDIEDGPVRLGLAERAGRRPRARGCTP